MNECPVPLCAKARDIPGDEETDMKDEQLEITKKGVRALLSRIDRRRGGRWATYLGPMRPDTYSKASPYGWSATEKGGQLNAWVVYKRDCPEYLDHVPVFRTRREAQEAVDQVKRDRATLEKQFKGIPRKYPWPDKLCIFLAGGIYAYPKKEKNS